MPSGSRETRARRVQGAAGLELGGRHRALQEVAELGGVQLRPQPEDLADLTASLLARRLLGREQGLALVLARLGRLA